MAKKNTNKAKHQPKNAKKIAPKSKPATTEAETAELEPVNESEQLEEQPVVENQDENTVAFKSLPKSL